jgi:hypothetical protein
LAQHAPELTHVRTEKTLAHRDLPPYGLYDLVLRDQPLRVLHEIAQDGERLATEMQLLAVLPEALVVQVESEGRK